MLEQEAKDLEQMKQDIINEKLKCINYQILISQMTNEHMNNSGYCDRLESQVITWDKSRAIAMALRDSMQKIEKIQKAYLKKYLD